MLTRTTDKKIPGVYLCLSNIENEGPGMYDSLSHTNNFFFQVSTTGD